MSMDSPPTSIPALTHPGVIWAHTLVPEVRVPLTLVTERLRLVPADVRHAEALACALNASYTLHREFLAWSQPHWTREQAAESLALAARDFFRCGAEKRYLVLPRNGAPEIVGCIGLMPGPTENEDFEIGYWANQRHAGQGLMKEALAALLALLDGQSLYLTTASTNTASQRLATAVGFKQVEALVADEPDGSDTFVFRRH